MCERGGTCWRYTWLLDENEEEEEEEEEEGEGEEKEEEEEEKEEEQRLTCIYNWLNNIMCEIVDKKKKLTPLQKHRIVLKVDIAKTKKKNQMFRLSTCSWLSSK